MLEELQAGRQVMGQSSAKVTIQHRLIYHHLIASAGIERAGAYADANRQGVAQIRRYHRRHGLRHRYVLENSGVADRRIQSTRCNTL